MFIGKLPNQKIGEILLEQGSLERGQLEKALMVQSKQGGLLGETLVRLQFITEEQLAVALAKQLKIPFIQLRNYSINRKAVETIPRELAQQHLVFPFDRDEGRVWMAMADPLNPPTRQAIEEVLPFETYLFLVTLSDVKDAIRVYYGNGDVRGGSDSHPDGNFKDKDWGGAA